jgi:DnaJ-class molecular chaperone
MNNYYLLLNISPTASLEQIKKAYKISAFFWHPDKNKSSNASEMFILITEAYTILSDIEKRKVYDRLYNLHFNLSEDLLNNQAQNTDFNKYQDWVNEFRISSDKILKFSLDSMFTELFHIIDKYGWIILITLMGLFYFIIMSLK